MSRFKSNKESGFPSGFNHYSNSPIDVAKMVIPTPDGFNNMVDSAIINQHQNSHDTKPVGTPGTTWSSYERDDIIRTEGGHALIFGNAPGSETLRVQSKSGATIELQNDGSVVILAAKGLHASIGADGQFVIQGDFHVVTNGDLRFKSAGVYFDCTDFHVNASGDALFNVHNNMNMNVYGDRHCTTVGDSSDTVGGDRRHLTAGSYTGQVSANFSESIKGTARFTSIGNMTIDTKAKMVVTAESDMTVSTKTDLKTQADGKATHLSKGDMKVATQAKMTTSAKGTMTVASEGQMEVGSPAGLTLTSSGTTYLSGPNVNIGGNVTVGGGSVTGILDTDGNQSILGTGGASVQQVPSRDAASTEVPKVTVDVPDDKTVIDEISDWVATDGELVKIFNAEQLRQKYDTEDGGTIPEKVKKRAQEKGITDLDAKPHEDSGVKAATSGVPKTATYALNTGHTFNPIG